LHFEWAQGGVFYAYMYSVYITIHELVTLWKVVLVVFGACMSKHVVGLVSDENWS
jgi:hypothetical protein